MRVENDSCVSRAVAIVSSVSHLDRRQDFSPESQAQLDWLPETMRDVGETPFLSTGTGRLRMVRANRQTRYD